MANIAEALRKDLTPQVSDHTWWVKSDGVLSQATALNLLGYKAHHIRKAQGGWLCSNCTFNSGMIPPQRDEDIICYFKATLYHFYGLEETQNMCPQACDQFSIREPLERKLL